MLKVEADCCAILKQIQFVAFLEKQTIKQYITLEKYILRLKKASLKEQKKKQITCFVMNISL